MFCFSGLSMQAIASLCSVKPSSSSAQLYLDPKAEIGRGCHYTVYRSKMSPGSIGLEGLGLIDVVIKVPNLYLERRLSVGEKERFKQDALAAERFSDECKQTGHSVRSQAWGIYILSEFKPGLTLKKLIEQGRSDEPKVVKALSLFLTATSQAGLAIGDLNPGNLIYDELEQSFYVIDGHIEGRGLSYQQALEKNLKSVTKQLSINPLYNNTMKALKMLLLPGQHGLNRPYLTEETACKNYLLLSALGDLRRNYLKV